MTASDSQTLNLTLPASLLEAIAQRAAELILQQQETRYAEVSPFFTIPEAAAYARCKRQRIDDLLSARRLTRHKDGRRTLILRAELEAHLSGQKPSSGRGEGHWMSHPERATVGNPDNKGTR